MSQNPKPNKKGAMFGGLGVLGILALKMKGLGLLFLNGMSLLKLGWLLKSSLSMFIVLGMYTMMFGPLYAVIVVVLLLIHEMGHFIFMKFFGLDPKAPMFIPFVGAYVAMDKMPADRATHAWVALAGPLVGGVTSAIFFYLGVQYNIRILMAAGATGCMLNMIQLIPARPLDGGFVVHAISRWMLIPGTGMAFAAAIFLQSPLFFIVAIMSVIQTIAAFRNGPIADGQKDATLPEKVVIGIAYFTLAGVLGYLYWMFTNETMVFMPANQAGS